MDGDGSQTPRSAARPDPTTIRSKAHLGRELTALREAARWSLRDLGRACEVPFGTLGGWLRGANLPQPGQIDAFDEVLSLCGIRSPAERNLWIATVARLRREGVPGERDGARPGHGEGRVPTTSRSSAIREGSYAGTRIRARSSALDTLRIRFTADDLARIRVAEAGSADEAVSALRVLRDGSRSTAFAGWRARVIDTLRPEAKALAALIPHRGPGVDLRTLTGAAPTIEGSVEALLSTPNERFRHEVHHLLLPSAAPLRAGLASGERDAVRALADAVSATYEALVRPEQHVLRRHLATVRATYAATLLDAGVEGLLSGLCPPMIRWCPPFLELRYSRGGDIALRGRGLLIVPTVLGMPECTLLSDPLDPTAPVTLTVPTVLDLSGALRLWAGASAQPSAPLNALLGRTRAQALRMAADGCSTAELARRLAVTPAAAGREAAVLRGADLIRSRQQGNSVHHTLTDLGARLLAGGTSDADADADGAGGPQHRPW